MSLTTLIQVEHLLSKMISMLLLVTRNIYVKATLYFVCKTFAVKSMNLCLAMIVINKLD